MEGCTHKQVVDLIKSCGDSLTLTVISVTPEEAERLEPTGKERLQVFSILKQPFFVLSDEMQSFPCVDYSEKRSLPISVPDYRYIDQDGERFVVSFFNIFLSSWHFPL